MNLTNDLLKTKKQCSDDIAVLYGLFPIVCKMRNEIYELSDALKKVNKRLSELEEKK